MINNSPKKKRPEPSSLHSHPMTSPHPLPSPPFRRSPPSSSSPGGIGLGASPGASPFLRSALAFPPSTATATTSGLGIGIGFGGGLGASQLSGTSSSATSPALLSALHALQSKLSSLSASSASAQRTLSSLRSSRALAEEKGAADRLAKERDDKEWWRRGREEEDKLRGELHTLELEAVREAERGKAKQQRVGEER